MYLILVVCHDAASFQKALAFTSSADRTDSANDDVEFKIVMVQDTSVMFENQVFTWMANEQNHKIWLNEKYTYICIVTYSFERKTTINADMLVNALRKGKEAGADVMSLHNLTYIKKRLNKEVSFIEGSTVQHGPFMLACITETFAEMGVPINAVLNKNIRGFFCNYWAATTEWMKKYIDFFATFKEKLMASPERVRWLHEDSWYSGNVSECKLVQISDRPYYTMHPFLYERLPPLFFHLSGAKIIPIGGHSIYHLFD